MTTTCRCGKPTAGAVLCDQCSKTLAYAIANVAGHYEDLDVVARKAARYGTGVGTRVVGKAQPLVVDMRFVSGPPEAAHRGASIAPGSQLRWDAWATIVAWCRVVMEEQPQLHGATCQTSVVTTERGNNLTMLDCLHKSCHTIKRRRWPRNTLQSMCLYLDRQHRLIEASEWGEAMLDELLDLEKRLVRMVNRPPDQWYAGKCSVPDRNGTDCAAELYAEVDRGFVDCRACGIRHDVGERRNILLREAQDILVTATEAAGALLAWTDYDGSEVKLVDLIRQWRNRKKVETRGQVEVGGKDRDLYRLGDVQALLIEHAQREQGRRVREDA